MPKKTNAKKLAAKEMRKQTAQASVEAGTGELLVARVEKALGFCQFLLKGPDGMNLTGLVRGLMKGGGENSSTRIRPGCYVFLSTTEKEAKKKLKENPKMEWEIAGVANRREEIERLKSVGCISRTLDLDELDLDDLFDRFDEEDEEAAKKADLNEDIWAGANPKKKKAAQMQAEAASQAAELLARYRKAQAGVKSQVAGCVHAERHVALAEDAEDAPEAAEEDFALWAAGDAEKPEKPAAPMPAKREITSKRRLAALAAAESAANAAAELERARAWAAANAEFEREQAALAELESRTVPANWEDELDIDAI